jgi:chromosome segregation protein
LESRRQLADRQSRLEQTAGRLEQLAQRVRQLEAGLATSAETRRARQAAVDQARQALDALEAEVQAVEVEAEHLNAAQDAARAETERLRRELGRKQAELQQIAGRLAALERLHAEGAGLYAGVRAVLQASEQNELPGLCGAFATIIQTPPELDRAIETALGAQMQDVVAERWEDAQAAIEWLKRSRAGRATFLPLDTLRPPSLLEIPRSPGIVGGAAELVKYAPRYHPAVLLHLGRTAIAESLDAARQLYRKLQGSFRIVTLDGEIVRSGGAVTGGEIPGGGKGQGEGLLARERDRRELPAQVEAAEAEVRTLRDALRESETRGQTLLQQAQALTERRRSVARRRSEAEQALDREVRALDKLIQEGDWQKNLLADAGKERERLEADCARLTQECAAAETALAEAEAQLGVLRGELDALTDDDTARLLADRRTQAALLEQEHENRRGLLEAVGAKCCVWSGRSRRRNSASVPWSRKGRDWRRRSSYCRRGTMKCAPPPTRWPCRFRRWKRNWPTWKNRWPSTKPRSRRPGGCCTRRSSAYPKPRSRPTAARINCGRCAARLRRRWGSSWGTCRNRCRRSSRCRWRRLRRRCRWCRSCRRVWNARSATCATQIHRLEPINMAAKEEYDEVEERRRFLREQMDDLEKASAQLKQVIAELDGMMETTFRTTFKGISTEFVRIFEILFNGGTAKLELMTDEEGQAGVDITARPPANARRGWGCSPAASAR